VPKSRVIRKKGKKNTKPKRRVVTPIVRKNKDKIRSRARPSRSTAATPASVPPVIPVPPVATTSAFGGSVAPVARTGSRASQAGKVAHLNKSKSKDLQIPAFGFIDVCFCVDSTGSMSSELAQVQEVIKAIITNI
jgi:hypothetical protein